MTVPLPAETAAILAAGPLCTCPAFPAAHLSGMHDEHGLVRDIVQVPSENWPVLQRAKCTRCGWISMQLWFAEEFVRPMAQNHIWYHRDRWTDACLGGGR